MFLDEFFFFRIWMKVYLTPANVWQSCSEPSRCWGDVWTGGGRSAICFGEGQVGAVEVQITECKGFISGSEMRVAELDAQRVRELGSLEKAEPGCKVSRQKRRSPGLGSGGGAVARESERVTGSESGTPGIFQTPSHWCVNAHVPTGPPPTGGCRPDVQ